jgi:pilus assembly protein CpaB
MARTIARPGSPERQNRLIFIGAIGLAALAAVLIFVGLRGYGSDDSGGGGLPGGNINVVVASREIPAGTSITGDMFELATLPQNGIVEGALTEREGLEGLVVRQNMARGEQFTAAKLGQEGDDEKTLSYIVPPGKRAVAVQVSEETSVGGLIVPGDHVDVVVVGTRKEPEDDFLNGLPASFVLLQDVEVLSVAQNTQKPIARYDKDGNLIETDTAEGSLSTRPDSTEAEPDADSVTLAVDVNDAAKLALAVTSYEVVLVLRSDGDTSAVDDPDEIISLPAE